MAIKITRMKREPAAIERVVELRHAAFFVRSDHTLAVDRDTLWHLASRSDDSEVGFVAEADGQLVGTCLLVGKELDQYHHVGPWLAGLVVRADWRGQGIGSALVRAIEDQARRNAVQKLFLYTYEAERFYRGLDWVVHERFVDSHGEACVLMVRDLSIDNRTDETEDDG